MLFKEKYAMKNAKMKGIRDESIMHSEMWAGTHIQILYHGSRIIHQPIRSTSQSDGQWYRSLIYDKSQYTVPIIPEQKLHIAIQKVKLFGIIWLLKCTSDEADEVHVHKRLFYGIINDH